MRKFRAALNFCQLKEIHLQNRKYTWSNERRRPTLVCIDMIFCNVRWDLAFENHSLHALSSSHSDHCPVLLAHQNGLRKPTPFKFENFWTKLPHFQDVVTAAWSQPTTHTEPFHRLSHKLHITGKALRKWSRSLISDVKLKLHMAQEVILRLDIAQENRDLSDSEHRLQNKLKKRILGWAVIEKARKRQSSRVTYLREGDANTKFFHIKANSRRRKNFIQRLKKGQGWAISHQEKQQVIHDHFSSIMADPPARSRDFNWDALCLPSVNLSSLDDPFTEQEVHAAIKQLPHDKAPGPDGYTGNFFKTCWNTVKQDLVAAINYFHMGRWANLSLLNKANIVLIPKKDGADLVTDYRPISLIHSFAKIISKILALRLAPKMHELISPCQSAFIKGRSIHDNFLYVRNIARRFHRNGTPSLLVKLDISKAFDSVRWDYLLSLMQHRGFPSAR